jgi:hypothetical protein
MGRRAFVRSYQFDGSTFHLIIAFGDFDDQEGVPCLESDPALSYAVQHGPRRCGYALHIVACGEGLF